jgi:hypothetical protein
MPPISTSSNDRERSQEQLGFLLEQRVHAGVVIDDASQGESQ